MFRAWWMVLLLGCGNTPPADDVSDPDPDPDRTVEPNAPGLVVAPPALRVVFPPPVSATDASKLTVRGTASSNVGVDSVTVDGAPVTSTDDFATWQVEVELANSENALVVEATDGAGRASTTQLVVHQQPIVFLQSPECLALAGTRAVVTDGAADRLITVDLATGLREAIARDDTAIRLACDDMATDGSSAFMIKRGPVQIVGIDLETGDRRIVSDSSTGSGTELAAPRAIAIDAAHNRLLVADAELGIIAIDPTTGDRTTLSPGAAFEVEVDGDRALILTAGPLAQAVSAVDLTTGARTVLPGVAADGDPTLTGGTLTLDRATETAFVRGPGIFAIDLAAGTHRRLPSAGAGPSVFRIAFDPIGNRLITAGGDVPVGSLEIATGKLTAIDDHFGSGPLPVSIHDIALARDTLVVDDVFGLVSIDLATAVRTLQPRPFMSDIDFDPNRDLLVGFDANSSAIHTLALDGSGEVVVASASIGNGPAFEPFSRLAVDPLRDRVLAIGQDVLAVDLATGDRQRLLATPDLVSDFAYDAIRDRLIVLPSRPFSNDCPSNAVLIVELDDGARSCTGPILDSAFDQIAVIGTTAYTDVRGAVGTTSIAETGLVAIDLVTGAHTLIADDQVGNGPSLVRLDNLLPGPDGLLVALPFGAHVPMFIDPTTGDRVMLAR